MCICVNVCVCMHTELTGSDIVLQGNVKNTKFCPVGKLLPGVQIVVLDDNLQPQPVGVPGEVSKYKQIVCSSHSSQNIHKGFFSKIYIRWASLKPFFVYPPPPLNWIMSDPPSQMNYDWPRHSPPNQIMYDTLSPPSNNFFVPLNWITFCTPQIEFFFAPLNWILFCKSYKFNNFFQQPPPNQIA